MKKRVKNFRKHKRSIRLHEKKLSNPYDAILTLRQVAAKLRLDPRTLRGVAVDMGGRRFGRCWRFHWGAVMEYFTNAKFAYRQKQSMARKGYGKRKTSSNEILSCGGEVWGFMARSEEMGRYPEGYLPFYATPDYYEASQSAYAYYGRGSTKADTCFSDEHCEYIKQLSTGSGSDPFGLEKAFQLGK